MIRSLMFVLVLMLATACGSGVRYQTDTLAPALGGEVDIRVKPLENGNYLVELTVEHLPAPGRISEGMSRYVVWFTGGDGVPRRAGFIDFNEGNRKGRFVATTTDRSFTLTITAEVDGDVTAPSEALVARQDVRL